MDEQKIRRQVLEELQRIAPEVEPELLRSERPLRDEVVDRDSMNWLRLLGALYKRLGGEHSRGGLRAPGQPGWKFLTGYFI